MSIVVFAGLTGHGKTYSAVENFIIPALKEGRHVAHNLQLFTPALNVVCERDCAPLLHQIPAQCAPAEVIAACPEGAVIVLDEVWEYWAKGLAINEVPKDELRFFRKHRHRVGGDGIASEMCLISHSPTEDLPAFIRSIVDLTYIHEKHVAVGVKGRFRVDVYSRCQSAERPTKSKLIRKLQGHYRPEVWNCYVSHTENKATKLGESGLEKMPDGRANIWKSLPVRAAIVALVLLPLLIWQAAESFRDLAPDKKPPKPPAWQPKPAPLVPVQAAAPVPVAASPAPVAAAQPAPAAPQPPPVPAGPKLSPKWRVLGGAVFGDGSGVVLLASVDGRRKMRTDECDLDDVGEWSCEVEDGLATGWSGTTGQSVLSADRVEGFGDGAPPLRGSPQAQGV